ncbi:S-phase kinase-associated protein [Gryllus bimaculatus]|nr:S-phase kinase-associated protein [Gryllus bimaculatus]
MLDNLGIEEGEDDIVPLPNVHSTILKKVIEWSTYHKDDPPAPEDDPNVEKKIDDICSWDANFLQVDNATLFDFIVTANYLDIKSLLEASCKTVAKMLIGKSSEELRRTFNIENDFTESDEEQLQRENKWLEEM